MLPSPSLPYGEAQADLNGFRRFRHVDRAGGMEMSVVVLKQVVELYSEVNKQVEGGFSISIRQHCEDLNVQALAEFGF